MFTGYSQHGSPPANRVHDLDAVARLEAVCGVLAARNNLFVDLHGQALAAEFKYFDEVRGSAIDWYYFGLTV